MIPTPDHAPPPSADANRAGAPSRLSIIVPVVRADDAFRTCLASLKRLDPPCGDLVVVVDGADPAAAALAAQAGARVVTLADRRGPAVARNAGARLAKGDLLLFVDADVALPGDAVGRVVATLDEGPDYQAVIGSYDDAPGAPNFLSQDKNLAHHFVHQTSREDAWTFWGACGAIRREAFLRAGGFDERYARPSIEDIELGSRLVAGGCRIRLDKSLQVTHLKRWTVLGLLQSEVRDRAIPWTRLILQTGRMPNDLNLRWSGRAAVLTACLLVASLAVTARRPAAWPIAVAAAGLLAGFDLPLLRFLRAKRGLLFTLRAFLLQAVHYGCCAAGFSTGVAWHLLDAGRGPAGLPAREPLGRLSGDGERE